MNNRLGKFFLSNRSILLIDNFNSVFLLVIIGIVSRIIYLPPNFTPIGAIALFSAVNCKKLPALSIPLLVMLISDYINNFNPIWYVYASFIGISCIGFLFKSKFNSSTSVLTASISSSILFFVITNFGVWLSSNFYSKNLLGLAECYYLAIPFFWNTLISSLFFSSIFFSLYYKIKDKIYRFKIVTYN